MPKVGKKTFPYTKSGVAAARKAASKPSMKKVSAKVKSTSKEEKGVSVYSWDNSKPSLNDSKLALKAGKDARGRASKYGKIAGNTTVYSPDYYNSKTKNKDVRAVTEVVSARGNKFTHVESKNQIKGKPDKFSKTDVYPSRIDTKKPKKTLGRDPKFGPAPKKKK